MRCLAAFLIIFSAASPAAASTAQLLRQLVEIPGISGDEAQIREAIEMLVPTTVPVRADTLGNSFLRFLRTGNGPPHTLVVAPLDEMGFVVPAITDDVYLRVHRPDPGVSIRLGVQFCRPASRRARGGRQAGVRGYGDTLVTPARVA